MIKAEERLEALKALLATFERMVEMKSCSPGEKSHMLAYHTDFIRREIRDLMRLIKAD